MENFPSPSGHLRNLREREKQVSVKFLKGIFFFSADTDSNAYRYICLSFFFQGSSLQEEKKKWKQQNVILSPQAGMNSCVSHNEIFLT